jgi:membrane-bound lytic murein transglycosylase B
MKPFTTAKSFMPSIPASLPTRYLVASLGLLFVAVCMPLRAQTHPGQAQLVSEVAKDTGKNPQALNALLDRAQKQQSILDAISRPAEGKPWKDYRPIFLTDKRINDGIAFYREHRELLERTAKQYGVAPEYIVAIIGVETSYGRNTGKYKVLDALVTLGLYYPPRASFFRDQLKTLLELPDNHLAGPIDSLTGSYAGAQGWGQFMPSSIRDFGVDADGDGHIDLKNSLPDIFASVANYFAKHGWQTGGLVALPAQPDAAAKPITVKDSSPQWPLEQLEAWGYAPLQSLNPGAPTSLQSLEGANGMEYWFTFQNFYVITKYNRSPLYALAVHQLAQAIAEGVRMADARQ